MTVKRFTAQEAHCLEAARRLRAEVYTNRGIFTTEELLDGTDRCVDDARSVHVGLWTAQDELVGTARVILDTGDQPLPVARSPFFVDTDHRPSGEISRYAIANGWNGCGLAAALWRELYWIGLDYGLLDFFAQIEGFLLDALLAAGLPFEVIGPAQSTYNTVNFPTRLRIDTLVAESLPRNPSLAAFLADGWRTRTDRFHPSDLELSDAERESFGSWWNSRSESLAV